MMFSRLVERSPNSEVICGNNSHANLQQTNMHLSQSSNTLLYQNQCSHNYAVFDNNIE